MINFSIIIPHKDIPSLLKRCVLSVPRRDDVQIIVLDDNSADDNKEKLLSFKDCFRQRNLAIIFLNESQANGAGHARNVGLEQAEGRWVVFADSDDTFDTDALNEAFDKYVDNEEDIIFFNIKCLDAETGSPRNTANHAYLDHLFSKNDAENRCRYNIQVPWGKFIKRELIVNNNIRFDESKVGNDAWFSLQIGYWANTVAIDYHPIYNWMVRSGSITSNKGKDAVLTHFLLSSRLNLFKETHNLSKYRFSLFAFIPMLVRAKVPAYEAVWLCIKHTSAKYILNDVLSVIKMKLI